MFKLKNIIIIVIIILTFGIAWRYYKKYRETDKLKVGAISLKATSEIRGVKDLVTIFKNGLQLKGFVEIRNFSSKDYTINQLSLDCFVPKTSKIIAEQTNIIQNNIKIKAKQSTNIPLEYKINILNALSLFKECGAIPADVTLWQVVSEADKYYKDIDLKKLKMTLKGFIEAEGITLSIDENYPLYD